VVAGQLFRGGQGEEPEEGIESFLEGKVILWHLEE
jgi:hypothetical protein